MELAGSRKLQLEMKTKDRSVEIDLDEKDVENEEQIEDENLVGKENGTTDAQAMVAAQQKMNESEKREAGE